MKTIEEIRESTNKRVKKHKYKLKFLVMKHYSKNKMCCACCGENLLGFLTIDKMSNNGKKGRKIVKDNLYRYLIKWGYPIGYQVLCYNCNFGKARFGKCPHEIMASYN